MDQLKVVVACSTGGHLVEVKRLAPVYEQYDFTYFTFSGGVADELAKTHKVLSIPNVNRRQPLSVVMAFLRSIKVVLQSRPDVVITTGAGIVVFYCILAKLLGAKLIFVESMAMVDSPTMTARLLYPFSDIFIVQWPSLLKFFPKAKYMGRLL